MNVPHPAWPAPSARAATSSALQALRLQPALGWTALQALALWPHARWAWARMHDGSDDPWGIVALGLALLLTLRLRDVMRRQPMPGLLAAAVGLSISATAALPLAPPLAAALLAALALACMLAAWLPPAAPRAALGGLIALSLPWMASLQFYVGYPLRVLTAELSASLLQALGIDALREGATMVVRGQTVMVDAPCSGVQMAWVSYVTACTVAAWSGLHDGVFLRRVLGVGAIVITGNVLRNAVLVTLESRPEGLSPMAHETIGVVVLSLVLVAVMAWMQRSVRS